MAVLDGVVERRPAAVVLLVGLGAVEDEPLHYTEVAPRGREVQRRRPVAVAGRHRERLLQDL